MTKSKKVVRFDWAIKHILRNKANFDVREGFLSALLQQDIIVLQLLDSESNQTESDQKFNRVDLLVQDSTGRHLIVEVQNQHESDYLQRLLFGTSKVIIEQHQLGQPYYHITKVISISILYFNLGSGDDYVYYGSTVFRGLHTHNPLPLRQRAEQGDTFVLREVNVEREIFPEYYLIQVERFADQVQTALDEWVYMFKHSQVRDDFQSKNIGQARQKLDELNMTEEARRLYERFLDGVARERDIMQTAHAEGKQLGLREGEQIGLNKAQVEWVLRLHRKGKTITEIAELTDLTLEFITAIIK